MSDRSPRQNMTKKSTTSIEEKRADRRAQGHQQTFSEQVHSTTKR